MKRNNNKMRCEKIIEKIKKNIDFKSLAFFLIVVLIFFGILVNIEYATDTYSVFTAGAKEDIIHFLGSGRFVTAFVTAIARVLLLSEGQVYIVSYIIAILCLVISLYEMNKMIQEDIKSGTISRIISLLIILNVFVIELFLFIEKGILIFSILMNVYAIKYLRSFLREKNKKDILKVLIFMFLANGSYQGTVGLFIAVSLVYIIKYSKKTKEFITNNVITAVCYAIPAILDLIIAKVFAGDRVSGKVILTESLAKVFSGTKNMIATYNIIPKYIFPIFVTLIIIAILYKVITSKQETKSKVLQLLAVCYIIVGTLVAALAPQLLQNTASIWMVPRSTYAFASLIGILMLYLFGTFKDIDVTEKTGSHSVLNLKNATITLSIIFIAIQYYNFTKIEISRYKLNEADKQVTMQIIDSINKYETETGKTITNIAIYQDKNISYTYKDIFITGDMNVKAYFPDWATKSIIKYYSQREVNFIDGNEDIATKFKENDWNTFDKEQLIFDNDTLHLCFY